MSTQGKKNGTDEFLFIESLLLRTYKAYVNLIGRRPFKVLNQDIKSYKTLQNQIYF